VSVPIVQKLWLGGRRPPQLKASSSETPQTALFVGTTHSSIRVWKTPKWFHKKYVTNQSIDQESLTSTVTGYVSIASPDIRTYGCKGITAVGLADTAALRVGSCSCMITYSTRIYPYFRPLKIHLFCANLMTHPTGGWGAISPPSTPMATPQDVVTAL
jgi:hypothetical protein